MSEIALTQFMRDIAKVATNGSLTLRMHAPLRPRAFVDGDDRDLLMPIRPERLRRRYVTPTPPPFNQDLSDAREEQVTIDRDKEAFVITDRHGTTSAIAFDDVQARLTRYAIELLIDPPPNPPRTSMAATTPTATCRTRCGCATSAPAKCRRPTSRRC